MHQEWVRFESIEIEKNGYFISYNPVFTGDPFATLEITFYEDISDENVISIIENEFKNWVAKYPTPLMVTISDETREKINYQTITGNEYLIGYPTKENCIKMVWGEIPEKELNKFDLSTENLFHLYSDLKYKTSNDAIFELTQKAKDLKKLKFVMILWFCVIPGLIAYGGWANPILSIIALLYSLYKAFKGYMEISGYKKHSAREKKKEEEKRLKNHYYYHCELNPEGFQRLKLDNLRKRHEQKLNNKIKSLRT